MHSERESVIPSSSFFRRPNPTVLVIRLHLDRAKDTDGQLVDQFLGGAFQVVMLVALTVLFGTMYGEKLFGALIFVLIFIGTILFARAFCIFASIELQKATNLTIVECDNLEEMSETEQQILEVPDIMVKNKIRGFTHFCGRRVPTGHTTDGEFLLLMLNLVLSCFPHSAIAIQFLYLTNRELWRQ